MLRKLMKYEFKATARTMIPLSVITLILSVFVSLFIRYGENVDNVFIGIIIAFLSVIYAVALCAVVIVVLVLMVTRFKNNILSDEGYITLTLPVSTHKIIWSKIIVSSVWFIVSLLVVSLSVFILLVQASFLGDLQELLLHMWNNMTAYYALNGTAVILELLLNFFIGYASFCLMAYAAMSIGYSFDRFKGLISLAVFMGLNFVTTMVTTLLFTSLDFDVISRNLEAGVGYMASVHLILLGSAAITAVFCVGYYFITTFMLKNRLNIE